MKDKNIILLLFVQSVSSCNFHYLRNTLTVYLMKFLKSLQNWHE